MFGPAVVAVAVVVVVVAEYLVGLPCDLLPLLATWYLYSWFSLWLV